MTSDRLCLPVSENIASTGKKAMIETFLFIYWAFRIGVLYFDDKKKKQKTTKKNCYTFLVFQQTLKNKIQLSNKQKFVGLFTYTLTKLNNV